MWAFQSFLEPESGPENRSTNLPAIGMEEVRAQNLFLVLRNKPAKPAQMKHCGKDEPFLRPIILYLRPLSVLGECVLAGRVGIQRKDETSAGHTMKPTCA